METNEHVVWVLDARSASLTSVSGKWAAMWAASYPESVFFFAELHPA
jgi:hypothetical protein